MSASSDCTSRDELRHLLTDLSGRGVRIWSKDGELRYRAPKGALTVDQIARLDALSSQIVMYLANAECDLQPRHASDRVPLTFTQLKYWHSSRLGERPARRTIASATRLCGPIDTQLLRDSIAVVVERHEALRTRIVTLDGVPWQEVARPGLAELEVVDLTGQSPSPQASTLEAVIHELMLCPIDIRIGPLFAARLARLGPEEHVLITVMEHVISDGFSRNVLLRDLFKAYGDLSRRQRPALPAIGVQLGDYAVWQRKTYGLWAVRHGRYWDARLAGCGRVPFPVDASSQVGSSAWASVPLRIDTIIRRRLHEWCRQRRTTPALAVFTAFAAVVMRWCEVCDAVIQYQTDGRSDPLLQNTVGYFAAALNLRIQLRSGDRLLDLLDRITAEYCTAYEHADFSYIEAQRPQPPFTRNPGFNWVPQDLTNAVSRANRAAGEVVLDAVPFAFPLPTDYDSDYDPTVLLFDDGVEITGTVSFPVVRFERSSMEAFGRDLSHVLIVLLTKPERLIQDLTISRPTL